MRACVPSRRDVNSMHARAMRGAQEGLGACLPGGSNAPASAGRVEWTILGLPGGVCTAFTASFATRPSHVQPQWQPSRHTASLALLSRTTMLLCSLLTSSASTRPPYMATLWGSHQTLTEWRSEARTLPLPSPASQSAGLRALLFRRASGRLQMAASETTLHCPTAARR